MYQPVVAEFIHDIQTQPVTGIQQRLGGRVVGGTYRVETGLLEQTDTAQLGILKRAGTRMPLSWWTQAPRSSVFLPFTKNPLVLQLRVRNPNQASASSTISPFFSSSALHWYSSGCSASQSRGWETGMSADAVPSLTSVSACATTFSPSRTETLTVSPPVTETFTWAVSFPEVETSSPSGRI